MKEVIKYTCLIILILTLPIAWGFLFFSDIPPKILGNITVILTFFSFLGFMLHPFINSYPKISFYEKCKQVSWLWMLASGITHFTWELSWCLLHTKLSDIFAYIVKEVGINEYSVQEIYTKIQAYPWTFPWSVYGVADARYIISDSFVVAMEWGTVVAGGINWYAYYLFLQKKEKNAALWAIVCCMMELYGTYLYYFSEVFHNFFYVNTENFIDLFFKFFGMNFLWVLFTVISIIASFITLKKNT